MYCHLCMVGYLAVLIRCSVCLAVAMSERSEIAGLIWAYGGLWLLYFIDMRLVKVYGPIEI